MIRRHAGSPTKACCLERNGGRAGVVVMALRWTDYLSSASPEAAAKLAALSCTHVIDLG